MGKRYQDFKGRYIIISGGKMKKDEIENGIRILTESLKNSKRKIKYKKDISYLRKMDGKFLDNSKEDRFLLCSVILTEDLEKVRLLDPVIEKIAKKQEIKFEDLGDIEI